MKEKAFRLTLGAAVVVGTAIGYFSLLSGVTYMTVMIRTSVAVAVIGLLMWLATVTLSKPSGAVRMRSANLADIVGHQVGFDQAAGAAPPETTSISEDDEEDGASFEPLDSGLARAL